jgi:acyl-homoserine lactone acylase PvdQ
MRSARVAATVVAISSLANLGAARAEESSGSTTTTDGGSTIDTRYRGYGDGGGFLNVLPPGQNAGVTETMLGMISNAMNDTGEFPPHYVDQLRMYEALSTSPDDLADDDLTTYFKDASFGVESDDVDRVYHPHDDVTVIRDKSFGVAHIRGVTRYATMYAQGYTTAEDRMFFMDVLRHVGRGRLAEMIGYDDAFIGRDMNTVGSSPYTEADLTAQVLSLAESGTEGASVVADVEAYADGVNAFMAAFADDPSLQPIEYKLLGLTPDPWIAEDAVSIATLVGGIFGRGGGREVENACGLQRLTDNLGGDAVEARQIFDDLHFVDDPTSPATGDTATPYELGRSPAIDPRANPEIDCSTLVPVNGASPSAEDLTRGLGASTSLLQRDDRWAPTVAFLGALATAQRDGAHMSNAILIGGDRTAAGRPIAVFGPQIGYSAPELLTEKDVHGPGIDARGVGFLGVDFYVLLGRGNRYAWSATSSGSDNVDQVILELCDPEGGDVRTTAPGYVSTGYIKNGTCVALEIWDHTVDAPKTALAPEARQVTWTVQRSEYGPLLWRGLLADGTPIAIAERRSTYQREVSSAFGFKRLNDPDFMHDGVDKFREAAGSGIDYTFNWFYVDDRDIAFQDSCRCPLRAEHTDPSLPVLAGSEFDWTDTYLTAAQLPHAVNPDSGYLVSWNNRPAPGWDASDSEFSYGPMHRSQLLSKPVEVRLAADTIDASDTPTIVRSDVVEIMRNAAMQDQRGVELMALLLTTMGEPAVDVDPRLLDLRERLEIWSDSGAFRRDADADGEYDDSVAPAIMDAWWPHIIDNVFADDGDARAALGLYQGGLDSFSDPGSALVAAIEGTTAHAFCGSDCRDELWTALAEAEVDLRDEFGTETIGQWQRNLSDDQIVYATLIAGMPSIAWQNRPTFQQVVQLETDSDRPTPSTDPDSSTSTTARKDRGADSEGSGAALPIVVGVVALGLIVAGAYLRQQRRRRN